ncbi:MAG: hypothetical protein AAGC97_12280, partial [Planctomycetota bacterium]
DGASPQENFVDDFGAECIGWQFDPLCHGAGNEMFWPVGVGVVLRLFPMAGRMPTPLFKVDAALMLRFRVPKMSRRALSPWEPGLTPIGSSQN